MPRLIRSFRIPLLLTIATTITSVALSVATAPEALADCRNGTIWTLQQTQTVIRGEVRQVAKMVPTGQSCGNRPSEPKSGSGTAGNLKQDQKRLVAEVKSYAEKLAEWKQCLVIDTLLSPATCSGPPERPTQVDEGSVRVADQPVLTPELAAYMAVANLRLVAPKPGIGPSPDINRWKIAAVGYPYWLWADGNTDPAPVTDTVADLTVSLDARLAKVVFQTGDGNAVTCQGTGTAWHAGVEPGSSSPTCGYRWTKPSLPDGNYTITAKTYWAVDWRAGGQNGTISIIQQASTQLPVGELQVTVR